MDKEILVKQNYSDFIIQRTYARWLEDKQRRETWDEIVDRYNSFMQSRVCDDLLEDYNKAIQYLRDKKILPSMRLLWTAGKACEVDNVCAYNCAYTPIDKITRFSEIMYLLMNGTGVGYSVERQYIANLPVVSSEIKDTNKIVKVEDSKEGWALAFRTLLKDWYNGYYTKWDLSLIRPKGAKLKTFGGRASGGEVLGSLFNFTLGIIKNAKGRKLHSDEVADIVNKTAEIVIAGGVRRSACITFSNLSDLRMREYKVGQFWLNNPQRALANISTAYTEKPEIEAFIDEWKALVTSGSGERGIVNVNMYPDKEMRMNPCAERALRPQQFCNLTEVVIDDNLSDEELEDRVYYATLLGTLQTTLTNFNEKVLSKEWRENTIKDSLLGVSLTGVSNLSRNKWEDHDLLKVLQDKTKIWNKYFVDKLKLMGHNINYADGITCNKPSGTVSQVVGVPSGIHPEYAPYYIRRVRVALADPISKLLVDTGVPHHPEVGQSYEMNNINTLVFEFPMKSTSTRIKSDVDAIEQLEYYKLFKSKWCDERGNPSCTVYVQNHEWFRVQSWVYDNWDLIGGLSFLPADNGVYQLAPYEEITKEQYDKLVSEFPLIDFSRLSDYEKEDTTEGAKTYACTAGHCEI